MTTSAAVARLTEERKMWRKDHPYGFVAKPEKKADGSLDLLNWTCRIPGKKGTAWEGGLYTVKLRFPDSFPLDPPHARFDPPVFHPNVWENGEICLSLLKKEADWRSSITLKMILVGLQDFLDTPNENDPANGDANRVWLKHRDEYYERIRAQAKKPEFAEPDDD